MAKQPASRQPAHPPWPEDIETLFNEYKIWCRPVLAARTYLMRKSGRSRPDLSETQFSRLVGPEYVEACCGRIPKPDATRPYTDVNHAKTLKHICNIIGADLSDARAYLDEAQYDINRDDTLIRRITVAKAICSRIENESVLTALMSIVRRAFPNELVEILEGVDLEGETEAVIGRVVKMMHPADQPNFEVFVKLYSIVPPP